MLIDSQHRRAMRKCRIDTYVQGATCDEWFVPSHKHQDVCYIHTVAKQEAQQQERDKRKAARRSLSSILEV